jgi:fructokinase
MPARIVVFGEILWDVFGDCKKLGGAPLNFTVHVSRLGHTAALISALGSDEPGAEARSALRRLGVDSRYILTSVRHPTGAAVVELGANGLVGFRIHRPAAYDDVRLSGEDLQRLAGWGPEWLYYGTLSSMAESSRALLGRLMEALPGARRFYDVNLRQDCYTPELVAGLVARAQVVKMNEDEMAALAAMFGLPAGGIETFCRAGAERFGWQAAAVTLGERGCGVWVDGRYAEAGGVAVAVADTVGAGDAFAAALVHGLSAGWPPERIGGFANRVGALVASRPGGTPEWRVEEIGPWGD